MPKIYEYFGLVFFFYSKEHLPVHVHVSYGDCENKIEFIYEKGKLKNIAVKKVKGHKSIPENKIPDVEAVIYKYEDEINKKWLDYFVKNLKPKSIKIYKKIKK